MEWQTLDAQSLALIDQKLDASLFSPSEYEIVRQVVYATVDFEYQSLIKFSDQALQSGASALAARTTIVVDVPMVQVAILPIIQTTFANPIYCSMDVHSRPKRPKPKAVHGLETLARRYPEAIFVVGQSQSTLIALTELIEAEVIRPALIVGTPAGFMDVDGAKDRLRNSLVPHIRTQGTKGNAVVAASVVKSLADLTWQAYGQDPL